MTNEEAHKVFNVLANADGGCISCVADLNEMVTEAFPEFPWGQWLNEWLADR